VGQSFENGCKKQTHMTQHFSKTMSKLTVMKDDLRGLVDDLYIQAEHAKIEDDIPEAYAQMQQQLANQLEYLVDQHDQETTD